MIAFATAIVFFLEIYFGIGFFFAVLFAWRGAAAIDPDARNGTIGFRVLILPASALLRPWLLARWLRHQSPPREHNAHRDAAASGGEL
jgi:hypothetical protein